MSNKDIRSALSILESYMHSVPVLAMVSNTMEASDLVQPSITESQSDYSDLTIKIQDYIAKLKNFRSSASDPDVATLEEQIRYDIAYELESMLESI